MSYDVIKRISELVESIKSHRAAVDAEAHRLRTPEFRASFNKQSSRSWCQAALGDSLVRVSLLLEQNFHTVETIGVIAVSRYLFELSVWLYLFEIDERYGLVYYGQLLETQQKYYSDFIAQLRREVEMLKIFAEKEREAQKSMLINTKSPEEVGENFRLIGQMIDAEAARKFSIHAEQAKENGYDYQAYLVEIKAIPQSEGSLSELRVAQENFNANVLPNIKNLTHANGKKKRWEWKRMAEIVGLISEYEFIYSFTSKLLHATPASITTDQKNLEPEEVLLFLKYIEVKILDVLDISSKYPHNSI